MMFEFCHRNPRKSFIVDKRLEGLLFLFKSRLLASSKIPKRTRLVEAVFEKLYEFRTDSTEYLYCIRLRSNNFSSAAFGRKARRPSRSPELILIDRKKYQKKMLNLNLLLHEEHFIARKLPPTSSKLSPLTSLLSELYTTNCI